MRRAILVVALLLMCPALMAQATRTWVSGVGDDANPCSRTAPCKTFAGAISKTAAGGEIDALDPGGFGAVTITKSITIDGGGTFASVLGAGTNGININTALTTDRVVLRNLSINGTVGTSPGLSGINWLKAAQVTLDNVRISGFNTACINGNLTAAGGELTVTDSQLTECGIGVNLTTSIGQLLASFDRTSIFNVTGVGVNAANTGSGSTRITMSRSNISHNNSDAVKAVSTGVQININDSTVVFNAGTAINASVAGSTIRLSNNVINNNNAAFNVVGTIISTGDNRTEGNGGSLPSSLPAYVVR